MTFSCPCSYDVLCPSPSPCRGLGPSDRPTAGVALCRRGSAGARATATCSAAPCPCPTLARALCARAPGLAPARPAAASRAPCLVLPAVFPRNFVNCGQVFDKPTPTRTLFTNVTLWLGGRHTKYFGKCDSPRTEAKPLVWAKDCLPLPSFLFLVFLVLPLVSSSLPLAPLLQFSSSKTRLENLRPCVCQTVRNEHIFDTIASRQATHQKNLYTSQKHEGIQTHFILGGEIYPQHFRI